MAEKRMFAKSIVLTDAFLDMPASARCLYFTLAMLADDDGFVGSPKSIMRQCGASQDDMMILLTKRYVLTFDSGVLVIKHWRIHNTLKNDRYHPTTYQEELAMLTTDQKGAYTEAVAQLPEQCFQNGSNADPGRIQIGSPAKDSIEKNSIAKNSKGKKGFTPPTLDEVKAYISENGYHVNPEHFYSYYEAGHWVDSKGQPVRNWKQKLITWEKKDKEQWIQPPKRKQYTTAENYKAPEKIDTAQLDKIRQAFAGYEMEM